MKKPWLEGMEVISQPVPAWGGWVETFVLTALVLAASFVTQQSDPFRLGMGFPWPILAPLLAGLRYGFVHGFASALAVLAALGVSINQQWQTTPEFPLAWAIGLVIVAMVAGEFRDIWGRRLHRLEGAHQYRAERLEEFTRNYQLLRLSHDRLEQTVANSGLSLREGIMHLQTELGSIDGATGLTRPSLQRLIEFVAEYGSLTRACIVGIRGDRIHTDVLAHIGAPFAIDENDPVLNAALGTGELTAVNAITGVSSNQNPLLMAAPLSDSAGEVHAVLLVKSMPFFAFHENNLKLVAVLTAHGIDHLRFGTAVSSVTRFIAAFNRLYQDHLTFRLDTALIKLAGSRTDVLGVNEKLKSSIRAIDMHCVAVEKGSPVLWLLLPLTDSAGGSAWMQRAGVLPPGVTPEVFTIREIDPERIRALVSPGSN